VSAVTSVVRDPVIAWHDELVPAALPRPEPPSLGPFTVTRSEVVTRASAGQVTGVTVHIWYAYELAVPRCGRPAIGVMAHGPGCTCEER
jgi:hypothetical protein